MKKLLSLFVLILMAFLLVGCDSIMDQIKGASGDGDGDGDDKTEEQASDKLEVSQTQSEQKMQEIAANGYELTFVYTSKDDDGEETGEMTMGAKGNVVWFLTGEDGMAIVDDETQYHLYSYEESVYSFEYTLPKEGSEELLSQYQSIASPYLYFANSYDGSLKKGADAKVSGRSCYTYEIDYSALAAVYGQMEGISNLKYKVYVDKTLGITMKVEVSATANGVSSDFSYEVTSFKQGSEVTAPRLPEPTPVEEDE